MSKEVKYIIIGGALPWIGLGVSAAAGWVTGGWATALALFVCPGLSVGIGLSIYDSVKSSMGRVNRRAAGKSGGYAAAWNAEHGPVRF